MSQNSYLGGSTIIGPGAKYFRSNAEDGNSEKSTSPDILALMAEHDGMRAKGQNPVAIAMAEARKAKAHRKKLKAEIRELGKELETLRVARRGSEKC